MTTASRPRSPTVGDALHVAAARLGGDVGARADAAILLAHVCVRDRTWLIAHRDDVLADTEWARFSECVDRRAAGHPVAYLTGQRGFWNLDLAITPDVLIPRPETELLVEIALGRLPAGEPSRALDLGTGSGAIALAIARERPHCRILAIDADPAALAVAQRNALRLDIGNVKFRRGDWLENLASEEFFHAIVANPPYLGESDPHLDAGDLRFEPRGALVSGGDGLDAIRTIVRTAYCHLLAGASLWLEHGAAQAADVRGLLAESGYTQLRTWPDLAGLDRVTGGIRP